MSFKERFSDEEQLLLSATPILIGSAMAMAESSGLATIKELMASAKTYMGGLEAYPHNEIIQGILPNLDDRKEAMAQAKEFRQNATARIKEKHVGNQEDFRQLLLSDTRDVNRLLKQKATAEESSEYKEWGISVAENVAKAAKEGGFLGFGGERISAGEKALFAELSASLGIDRTLA